ncbi:hypothetical protein TNCV_2565281 [Trichonephila clavipes]|uniref:Uncharacterized protein n=1 Tax=Trichonephila clavipes TaxID=2585209 RepID=A0A8X6SFZ8_TRICX|nr:hypothetical protein TNCV_2565281 [Trichonephila clavipes]
MTAHAPIESTKCWECLTISSDPTTCVYDSEGVRYEVALIQNPRSNNPKPCSMTTRQKRSHMLLLAYVNDTATILPYP